MANLTEKIMPYKKRKENYQPNAITKSKQQFSLQEQKIVAFIINQIDHEENYSGGSIKFEIPLSELSNHLSYDHIKKTAKSLLTKQIWTEEEEEHFQGIVPFTSVKYEKGKGLLTVKMNEDIVPYFIGLGKEYTKYPLEIFLSFDSVYTQRLYQIFMMYDRRKQKKFVYNINTLQNTLNCEYPDFYDFKRRVLDPTQKELEEKANFFFSYAPSKKEGKKVVEIQFNILNHVDLALKEVDKEGEEFQKLDPIQRNIYVNNLLKGYKFPSSLINAILENRDAFYEFIQIESEVANGIHKVKNPAAYLATAMRNFCKDNEIEIKTKPKK